MHFFGRPEKIFKYPGNGGLKMSKLKNKAFGLFLIIAIVLCLVASPALAINNNTELDKVVFQVGNDYIVVKLADYASAFEQDGDLWWEYLKDGNDFPDVYAVASGDKYMSLVEYATNYIDDVAEAIGKTDALPSSEVAGFKMLTGFDDEDNPILEPLLPFVVEVGPIKKVIEVPYGTPYSDIPFDPADEVVVTLSDGSDSAVDIIYASAQDARPEYDPETPGTYAFDYELNSDDYHIPAALKTGTINVTVEELLGEILFKYEEEEVSHKPFLFTLANDGAREFKVLFKGTPGIDESNAKVRIQIYDHQDNEIVDPITETGRTITGTEFNILTAIAPELSSDVYKLVVRIDFEDDGQFDYTESFNLFVGRVGVEGLYDTFMTANHALSAGGDNAYVTLYDDVAEDITIQHKYVTLDLNGFTTGNFKIDEGARNPHIKGGVIDGDLTISWDGVVKIDDNVEITGDIIFEGVGINNAKIEGNPTIGGTKVYAAIGVSSAGELENALMNQYKGIFFSENIVQTATRGDLEIIYNPTINLGPHTLYLEGVNIDVNGPAALPKIKSGVAGSIQGTAGFVYSSEQYATADFVYGNEQIIISNEARLSIMGADGDDPDGNPNVMNIEDIALFEVSDDSILSLSKVQFDEGNSSEVGFDIAGILEINNFVTSNDVDLTFIGGSLAGNWNSSGNSEYGTVQGDGRIEGSGKILIYDAPNYHFRGEGGLLTIDLLMDVRIDEDMEGATDDNRNIILSNLELWNQVRLDNNENVIIDDAGGTVLIEGESGVNDEGLIVGADGTSGSGYRVVVNRGYLSGPGDTYFEDITLRQVAFNIQSSTNISEHYFDERVFVEVNSGQALTATGNVYVIGDEVEFGSEFWTSIGTFNGLDETVYGPGSVVFTADYDVEGSSWFTLAAPVELRSNVTFSNLRFNDVFYREDDLTVTVEGDLRAYDINGNVRGRFIGSGVENAIIDIVSRSKLDNLTLTDIEELNVNATTIIEDVLGETRFANNAGLDVRNQTQQGTIFNIAENLSLIVANTNVRVHDDEILEFDGEGVLRGVGGTGGKFYTDNTGIIKMVEDSALIIHGDRNGNLVFDLAVEVDNNSITDLGSVWFADWVSVNDDATLRAINNKTSSFEKGIDIEDNVTLEMLTASYTIPPIPEAYVMSNAHFDANHPAPGVSDISDDNIIGKIMGVNGKAEVRGQGAIRLGSLLKVEDFSFKQSLDDVILTDEQGILTFANIAIENQEMWFTGWELYLDGDVELVEVNDNFPALFFVTEGDELSKLHGQGRTIHGDGDIAFRSSTSREAEADDITFDIRRHSFPYEVNVGEAGPAERLVIFNNAEWTNQTTVNVNTDSNLRFEGTCKNNGGLRVWKDGATDEYGLENRNNLTRPEDFNIDFYNR